MCSQRARAPRDAASSSPASIRRGNGRHPSADRHRLARPPARRISPNRAGFPIYARMMTRTAAGLSARGMIDAAFYGVLVVAAVFGAIALIAAPTAVDLIRLPVYAALGAAAGWADSRRTRHPIFPRIAQHTRAAVTFGAGIMPCVLSIEKLQDLGWDQPALGTTLFAGGCLSVAWHVAARRRVARRRRAQSPTDQREAEPVRQR